MQGLKFRYTDIPAGIAECVAFDSAMNLVAKRLVFLNINKKLTVEITPDKLSYAPREKVSLAIEVKNENGNPCSCLTFAVCLKFERAGKGRIKITCIPAIAE